MWLAIYLELGTFGVDLDVFELQYDWSRRRVTPLDVPWSFEYTYN